MKILHTSDWHLGRTLYGRRRTREFEAFLEWLAETLRDHNVDALIVAGNVFDTTTPSNRMQQLYYRFLRRVTDTGCRHAVIVGGNHDSPSFLDAPKELLSSLDVHVVGAATENPRDELLTLRDAEGKPELLVCAVPCLRDKDVRVLDAGETFEEKDQKRVRGIEKHYEEIARLAEAKQSEFGYYIPVIATGHLFVTGGQRTEGDGVRDIFVGTMAPVGAESFPSVFDYLALGHLHSPQKVGASGCARYSGAPLPMHPGEGERNKSVVLVTLDEKTETELLPVPVFQEMKCLSGDLNAIGAQIGELRLRKSTAWLEIIYDGTEILPDLRERLKTMIADSSMEILRVRNIRTLGNASGFDAEEAFFAQDGPDVREIFMRCLESRSVPKEQRPDLIRTYEEVLTSLESDDPRAE